MGLIFIVIENLLTHTYFTLPNTSVFRLEAADFRLELNKSPKPLNGMLGMIELIKA